MRRVDDDPAFDYEVVSGARRHWSVSYLRNVEHREIRYLIEERELTDEQAFRLADVENRSRRISAIMSGRSTIDTPSRHSTAASPSGWPNVLKSQGRGCRAFWTSASSRIDVVEAFGDIRLLRENHAREIKPLLAADDSRPTVMAEAKRLAAQQAACRAAGKAMIWSLLRSSAP